MLPPLTWPKFAGLLSRHLEEVPNLLAHSSRLIASPPYRPKSEAARELSIALNPLFDDLDGIRTLQFIEDEASERMLTTALVKQQDGDVQEATALENLCRDCFAKIHPYIEWIRTVA